MDRLHAGLPFPLTGAKSVPSRRSAPTLPPSAP
jgi:hypothetical protein